LVHRSTLDIIMLFDGFENQEKRFVQHRSWQSTLLTHIPPKNYINIIWGSFKHLLNDLYEEVSIRNNSIFVNFSIIIEYLPYDRCNRQATVKLRTPLENYIQLLYLFNLPFIMSGIVCSYPWPSAQNVERTRRGGYSLCGCRLKFIQTFCQHISVGCVSNVKTTRHSYGIQNVWSFKSSKRPAGGSMWTYYKNITAAQHFGRWCVAHIKYIM